MLYQLLIIQLRSRDQAGEFILPLISPIYKSYVNSICKCINKTLLYLFDVNDEKVAHLFKNMYAPLLVTLSCHGLLLAVNFSHLKNNRTIPIIMSYLSSKSNCHHFGIFMKSFLGLSILIVSEGFELLLHVCIHLCWYLQSHDTVCIGYNRPVDAIDKYEHDIASPPEIFYTFM